MSLRLSHACLALALLLLAACGAQERQRGTIDPARAAAIAKRPAFQRLYPPVFPSEATPRLTPLGDFDTPRSYDGRSWRHRGIDIRGEIGDPVIAVAPGEACIESDEINGLSVVLYPRLTEETDEDSELVFVSSTLEAGGRRTRRHALEIRYAHLRNSSPKLRPCGFVQMGAVLGTMGVSGIASAPHLHFEIVAREPGALPGDPLFGGAINPFYVMRREPGDRLGAITCYKPGMAPRPNAGDAPNSLTIVWPTMAC